MSGGHWDCFGFKLEYGFEAIAEDETVKKRWPSIGELARSIGSELAKIEHDMDWDISGDSLIKDDAKWERERIGALLEVVMKSAPDEWFPRGKWATIQAIQERIKPTP